jgi:hypothetical protein
MSPVRLPDALGRMTPHRKSLVLLALRRREVTRAHVLARYRLTEEELLSWEVRFARHGQPGLSVHRLQALGR